MRLKGGFKLRSPGVALAPGFWGNGRGAESELRPVPKPLKYAAKIPAQALGSKVKEGAIGKALHRAIPGPSRSTPSHIPQVKCRTTFPVPRASESMAMLSPVTSRAPARARMPR